MLEVLILPPYLQKRSYTLVLPLDRSSCIGSGLDDPIGHTGHLNDPGDRRHALATGAAVMGLFADTYES